jgi:imidazole glycerol-phosphate synthase subunit HisH
VTVVLVDYGSGNLRSLRAAMERAGSDVAVSDDPAAVAAARRLMVPGQGAAGPTMATLRRTGLERAIREAVANGAFLLGVCVGLQLLFDASAEDDTPCLGFLPGRVERLDGTARLPHMGWNDVEPVGPPHPLAAGLPACAYFAHSYAVREAGPAAVAETEVDGVRFTSVVAAGRVAGAQFHPERSAGAGLQMLRGFLEWSDAA